MNGKFWIECVSKNEYEQHANPSEKVPENGMKHVNGWKEQLRG